MTKPKETYKATYRAGAARIRKELLPERLPYMNPGWVIDSMEMRASGAMSDGREFQDVRIYLRESAAAPDPEPLLDPGHHTEATRARIREHLRGEGL